jgi:diguanylate cyclase (GGDEF)-like protein
MAKEKKDEVKELKKDLFDLMEARRDERELMLKFINSISILASEYDEISGDIRRIKSMITPDGELDFDEIEGGIHDLKKKFLEKEKSGESHEDILKGLTERLIESCRILKRVMAAILDDFYPLSEEMKNVADGITIDCKGDVNGIELKKPSDDLLEFIDRIKIKISEDFNDTNRIFFILLEQVKELEKSLVKEFGDKENLKQIEYFEMNINREVGSIAESFNSYANINEIKNIVIEKLKKIKNLVSLKKKEEIRKNQVTQENIKILNKKIMRVERRARKLSLKAKQFQKAAMRDALTGLFNRGAFDLKIREAINTFNEKDIPFSVVLFDVNKFKEINDSLGHIAGDKVLQKIAECLTETFRKDDFIARYGGDEFIVIIEDLTEEMSRDRIKLFNKNLKKRRFVSHVKGDVNLTMSTGTAMVKHGDTPESVINRADQDLYGSKQDTP